MNRRSKNCDGFNYRKKVARKRINQKDGDPDLDVWEDTALGDGDAGQQLVQLLIVPDGELEMPGDDAGLLVVPGGVPGQLEDLGGEVLHDSGHVDGGPRAHPLGVVSLPEDKESDPKLSFSWLT